MKKLTVLAAAIATMSTMSSFAHNINGISVDSDSARVSALVYDLIKIDGLDNQLFLANDYDSTSRYFEKVDNFRVVRRGAWMFNPLPYNLKVRQVGPGVGETNNYSLFGFGKPAIDMTIGVNYRGLPHFKKMDQNDNGRDFYTNQGFISSNQNMSVRYRIPNQEFLKAEKGGYSSRFVFSVAAL